MASSLQYCTVVIDGNSYIYDRNNLQITYKLYEERDREIIYHLCDVSENDAEILKNEGDLITYIMGALLADPV